MQRHVQLARPGFTLIELLVVITIIIVLLALLTPALDKAIYQAELTVCASQLRGIGVGVVTYAAANKRYYPDRGLRNDPSLGQYPFDQPAMLKHHPSHSTFRPTDQRVILKEVFGDLNKHLNDPLTGEIDIEGSNAHWVFTPYNLWWGFRYTVGTRATMKLGDRFDFRGEQFSVLASDRDMVRPQAAEAQSSHPDDVHEAGALSNVVLNEQMSPWVPGTITISLWYSGVGTSEKRGAVDNNYAMDDLSVQRFDRVVWDRDQRLRVVGVESGQAFPPGHYMYLP